MKTIYAEKNKNKTKNTIFLLKLTEECDGSDWSGPFIMYKHSAPSTLKTTMLNSSKISLLNYKYNFSKNRLKFVSLIWLISLYFQIWLKWKTLRWLSRELFVRSSLIGCCPLIAAQSVKRKETAHVSGSVSRAHNTCIPQILTLVLWNQPFISLRTIPYHIETYQSCQIYTTKHLFIKYTIKFFFLP